jgi:hypothetical protein
MPRLVTRANDIDNAPSWQDTFPPHAISRHFSRLSFNRRKNSLQGFSLAID